MFWVLTTPIKLLRYPCIIGSIKFHKRFDQDVNIKPKKVTDTLADKIKIVVQEVKTEMSRFVVQGIKSKLLRRRLRFNVRT